LKKATIKLRELVGTQYLCEHHTSLVSNLIDECPASVIDLAGLKIAKGSMDVITAKLTAGVEMVDTEDAERNALLQQAVLKNKQNYEMSEELPILTCVEDFPEYLASLDPHKLYREQAHRDDQYTIALLVLIQVYRPAIQIVTSSAYYKVAAFISSELLKDGYEKLYEQSKTFVATTSETSYNVTFETNKPKESQHFYGLGDLTFEDLCSKVYLIPDYFGSAKIQKDPQLKEYWRKTVEASFRMLEEYFVKSKKSIKSFLGF